VSTPSPQRYESEGRRQGVDRITLDHALAALKRIRDTDPRITPVLTLRHLAVLTGLPYMFLRRSVARRARFDYKHFALKKRIPGRSRVRIISMPTPSLKEAQQWIVEHVLRFTRPHAASYAFHPDSSPVLAAEQHPRTRWLLKVDIEDFFHSVSEGTVTGIFTRLGFPKLLSFELARLCTIESNRVGVIDPALRWTAIPHYQNRHEGVLPQGAPTSPMLANLAMAHVDERLAALARRCGCRYSRYADDLAFSTDGDATMRAMVSLRREVYHLLNEAGFSPNRRKTAIRGPGSRRIVLGLLVDGATPRLQLVYKDMIRLHLHYLTSPDFGPAKHALARKTGVSSLYHHVRGLISWAELVERDFGGEALRQFNSVAWPPIQRRWLEGKEDV
jgi:RNA-directed DNA polymerase